MDQPAGCALSFPSKHAFIPGAPTVLCSSTTGPHLDSHDAPPLSCLQAPPCPKPDAASVRGGILAGVLLQRFCSPFLFLLLATL